MSLLGRTDLSAVKDRQHANLKSDFLASIVVFLVALPLCMGIAIASGVPIAAGLITGIVGGIVVGALAGCPLQVSGPAAGLSVIVFEIVHRFGFELLGVVVLIAGAIQLLAGTLKLGQWFRAVSPAVIKGMLAGIGVLIFASQFHVMLDDAPQGSGIQNLISIPTAVSKAITWPDFATREKRRYRVEVMRKIGELQRRQEEVAAHFVKPKRTGGHGRHTPQESGAVAGPRVPADGLSQLITAQDAIQAELESITADLRAFEKRVGNTKRSTRIVAACSPTTDAAAAASNALREGNVDRIASSQATAVQALGKLAGCLKNHNLAAQIGLLTIISIVAWQTFIPQKFKLVPAPLVAVVIATGAAAALSMPILYVEVPDSLWSEIRIPDWTVLRTAPWPALLQSAFVVAIVASAETLLCATAVDQMHRGPRTKYDKELVAQGIGNMVCGAVNALPMTGVIVRSTANIQSGGTSRVSAIFHGVWLLIFVAFLAFLLRLIPTAALAAILVYTGYKLVNPKSIKELRQYGWSEVGIYAATVTTIVVTDLLTGVITGVALAAAKLLHTFSRFTTDLKLYPEDSKAVLSVAGAATFIRLPRLATELERVPKNLELHVDFQQLDYIDHACLDLLINWAKQHEATGGRLVIDWASLHARFRAENGNQATLPAAAEQPVYRT